MLRDTIYYSEYEYIENIIKEPFLNRGKSLFLTLLFLFMMGVGYYAYLNWALISSFLEPNMVFMQEYNDKKSNSSKLSDRELQAIANRIVHDIKRSSESKEERSPERQNVKTDDNFNELMSTLDALSKELKNQEVHNRK